MIGVQSYSPVRAGDGLDLACVDTVAVASLADAEDWIRSVIGDSFCSV